MGASGLRHYGATRRGGHAKTDMIWWGAALEWFEFNLNQIELKPRQDRPVYVAAFHLSGDPDKWKTALTLR
jgi:hypothetical protein